MNLPFFDYKWYWATKQPTESINDPSVFLGVLRALHRHRGEKTNSSAFVRDLELIQQELETTVDMVRSEDRNIIRNSGQYWKLMGVLEDTRPGIKLTEFGVRYAEGLITQSEFALEVIDNLTLPNPVTYSQPQIDIWRAHGLEIRPLEYILNTLAVLRLHEAAEGYLTPDETARIVIVTAGSKGRAEDAAQEVLSFRRRGHSWAGYAEPRTADNDGRFVREYLLWLDYYGFVTGEDAANRSDRRKYFLIDDLAGLLLKWQLERTAEVAHGTSSWAAAAEAAAAVERNRVTRSILSRPGQGVFHDGVFALQGAECLLTGVTIPSVLQAAHLRPVASKGSDAVGNGICLRSDVHALFDAGHLRIDVQGNVHKSISLASDPGYVSLPTRIVWPDAVDIACVEWRWNYE